jgi:hypothetical protein
MGDQVSGGEDEGRRGRLQSRSGGSERAEEEEEVDGGSSLSLSLSLSFLYTAFLIVSIEVLMTPCFVLCSVWVWLY